MSITNYKINGINLTNLLSLPNPILQTNISTNANLVGFAMSDDGTIIYSGGNYNTTFIKSINSGKTWTTTNINVRIFSISTSSNGQYLLIYGISNSFDNFYAVSNNYGTSFTYFNPNIYASNGSLYNITAVSSNGKYMFIITNKLLFSNDYGVTWNIFSVGNNTFTSTNFYSIVCNSLGNYVYFTSDQGLCLLKTNASEPYTISSYTLQTIILNGSGNNYPFYIPTSVNSSGSILYGIQLTQNNLLVIKITNYGQNMITLTGLPVIGSGIFSILLCNSTGQNVVLSSTNYSNIYSLTGFNYYSSNYGQTWSQLVGSAGTAITQSCIKLDNTGSYIYYVTGPYNNGMLNKYTFTTGTSINYFLNNIDIGGSFMKKFAIEGSNSYNYLSPKTGFKTLVNSVLTDIGNLISPKYTIYTNVDVNRTPIEITTETWCNMVIGILIGGGGGGGSGGANNNPSGAGGAGGGGGGGGIGVIYIINSNPGTAMSLSYIIGSGGIGGSVLTTIGTGRNGTAGGDTVLIYNDNTYTVNGGAFGSGGNSSLVGGAGGTGGSSSGNLTFIYNGISGTQGMSKISGQKNQVMGGIGGLSGNYNITYSSITSANTVPTPSITYTINSQNVIDDNVISLINATNVSQNGSGQYNSPTITYNTYYGQGGYGGDSDTNVTGKFGFAGSNGQQGALILCQYNILPDIIPTFILTGTGTSQVLNGYTIVTFTAGSGTITFNKQINNLSCICVAGGGGGGASNVTTLGLPPTTTKKYGSGGSGGGMYLLTTTSLLGIIYNITVGTGGSGSSNINAAGGKGGISSITYNLNTLISCTGGSGSGSNGSIGAQGNVTIPVTSGGEGGSGGYKVNGINSTSYNSPFNIPNKISSIVQSSYSGGGGGATSLYGGGAGRSGLGGILNGSTTFTGENATTYGSGGGGGGVQPGTHTGGNGAPGVVIFFFQNT
jgi:hypothetical protein